MLMILCIILLLVIAAAVYAAETGDLYHGVIALGAVGIGTCAMLLLFGAPELALVQMIVEFIILIILVGATDKISPREKYKGREIFSYLMVLVFVIVIVLAAYNMLDGMPAFGAPSLKTGEAYREFEELAAAAALFASAVGCISILRARARKPAEENDDTDI